MISPAQVQLVQIARRACRLDEASYRLLLANVGAVQSTKDLSQEAFEDVMSVLEAGGFIDQVHGEGYWSRRTDGRHPSGRQLWLIRKLAAESRYELPALCRRFSGDRTENEDRLSRREAWNLIEMLKASSAREQSPPVPAGARADASNERDPAAGRLEFAPVTDDEVPF